MIIGVLLAAGAVASVGTIGFLGLMAPHAVRMMVGHHTRRSIILSGLLGALLLVIADTIGRTVMAPKEIPSGLIIMLIGAPYFLFLMYRSLVKKGRMLEMFAKNECCTYVLPITFVKVVDKMGNFSLKLKSENNNSISFRIISRIGLRVSTRSP